MSIFKEGKKVSLRKVVKKSAVEEKDHYSNKYEIDFPKDLTAVKIMKVYQSDSFLSEFYQFLCGTG